MSVINFVPPVSYLKIDPDIALTAALAASLEAVIIIGQDKDGEFYLALSEPDASVNNLLLDVAKDKIMQEIRNAVGIK